jgi:predicted RNase H-like nuclease
VVLLYNVATEAVTARVVRAFSDVLSLPERPVVVGVDMPVGLLNAAIPGGRECDRRARALLGRPRASSVFTPPVRAALGAATFRKANAVNRASSPSRIGITLQTFNILGKMAEVDRGVTAAEHSRVLEVHPELSFLAMAERPPLDGKKSAAGRAERLALLAGAGFPPLPEKVAGAAPDDVVDAAAACWTALRIRNGKARRVPERPSPLDARGLRMEIWR